MCSYFKANCCLKVHNAPSKLASPISGQECIPVGCVSSAAVTATGVSAQGGGCLQRGAVCPGGLSAQGGLSAKGGCLPRRVCPGGVCPGLPAWGRGVCRVECGVLIYTNVSSINYCPGNVWKRSVFYLSVRLPPIA